MNVIVIQIDSLCRHFLAAYGNEWVQTPHLDRFAQRAAVFDNHFVGSLPCMPARREIWTGTEGFWWRFWGPLEMWDRPIAYLARQHDIRTHLVTDHYHFFEWGSHSYHHDFHGYDFIRGHEMDNWRSDPVRELPDWAQPMVAARGEAACVYLQNVQDFREEADFFAPKVFSAAARWLDRNHDTSQFYLHIDSFDVHEPFHIPEPYRSLYSDDDYRRYNIWPLYGRTDGMDSAEIDFIRAQFAGKLTMVDRWLGELLARLDRYRLWDNTAVIVTTDHGHYLGEHGWMGKPNAPLYDTLCHIPLLVWLPGGASNGQRVATVTQTVDLYATVLELLNIESPVSHSRSFLPLLQGETNQHRDYAVYGYWSQRVGITDGTWTLLRDHDHTAAPAYLYTNQIDQTAGWGFGKRDERRFEYPEIEAGRWITGVETPQWRRRVAFYSQQELPRQPDLLFHQPTDPKQQTPRHAPGEVQRLEQLLTTHANQLRAPREQLMRLQLA